MRVSAVAFGIPDRDPRLAITRSDWPGESSLDSKSNSLVEEIKTNHSRTANTGEQRDRASLNA